MSIAEHRNDLTGRQVWETDVRERMNELIQFLEDLEDIKMVQEVLLAYNFTVNNSKELKKLIFTDDEIDDIKAMAIIKRMYLKLIDVGEVEMSIVTALTFFEIITALEDLAEKLSPKIREENAYFYKHMRRIGLNGIELPLFGEKRERMLADCGKMRKRIKSHKRTCATH